MSSYFDNFDREVAELGRSFCTGAHCTDSDAFIKGLEVLEEKIIRDCELFAGDMETPQPVRECVMAVIALEQTKGNDKVRQMNACCLRSGLSHKLHGLFHDIARMRYEMRYAMVFDNPAAAVSRRDLDVEEREREKLPHPWQSSPPSEKPLLVVRESPAYCQRVVAKFKAQEDSEVAK